MIDNILKGVFSPVAPASNPPKCYCECYCVCNCSSEYSVDNFVWFGWSPWTGLGTFFNV